LKLNKLFSNVTSLQLYQLIRFTTFLLISILFAKSHLSRTDIGMFEMFMFMAGFMSFFWVTGLIQSFLSLANNNKSFNNNHDQDHLKSPEIFNTFILLTFFSILVFAIGLVVRNHFIVFGQTGNSRYLNLVLVYVLVSNPPVLIEYIYLVKNRSNSIMGYGLLTYAIQLFIVTFPVLNGYDIVWALYAVIAISLVRMVWLFVLLFKYARFEFSWSFIREHLRLGSPLIVSALLSGSAQYIDGIVVSNKMDATMFAVFRYGAKEFPLVIILANGLSNAMISEIGKPGNLKRSMDKIRYHSRRLMHFLFPVSMVVMLFTRWLYPVIFNPRFIRSADIFLIYLLIIISRLIFPQTLLIGLKKTRIIMLAATVELFLNVILSLFLIRYYGTVGVALATVIVFIIEKVFLVAYNFFVLKIRPNLYIPVKTYLVYTCLIILEFVLIDRRIIDIH